jgi:3-oxoadipate enol-lactonase
MIREMVLGVTLLVHSPNLKGQVPSSIANSGVYVDVGGSKVWYEECGSAIPGPGVVLLHDGLVHSVTWDGIWQQLCSKYHVVRYDRRGYGRSEPAKNAFVPENDLLTVMRTVHMNRAVIVGNSSGGALAIDFALAHPTFVSALFLIGPVVHGMASSQYFDERGNENNVSLSRGDTKTAAKRWSQDRFLIAGDDPTARKKLYEVLAANPQNLTIADGLAMPQRAPSVTRLSEIKVPTMVLVGDADIGDVFANAGAVEAAVPLASFEIWKDTGHLIQLQRPTELVSSFNRFMGLATRQETQVSERTLAEYVGQYKIYNLNARVVLRDGRLFLNIPGSPERWLFAASETRFFLRTGKTEIEFRKGAVGIVAGMTIYQSNGRIVEGVRTNAASGL